MKWPEKSKKIERDTTTTIIPKRGMTSSERATTTTMLSMPFSLRFDTILFVTILYFLNPHFNFLTRTHPKRRPSSNKQKCPPVEASSTSIALRAGRRTHPSFGPNKPFAFFSLCECSLSLFFQTSFT